MDRGWYGRWAGGGVCCEVHGGDRGGGAGDECDSADDSASVEPLQRKTCVLMPHSTTHSNGLTGTHAMNAVCLQGFAAAVPHAAGPAARHDSLRRRRERCLRRPAPCCARGRPRWLRSCRSCGGGTSCSISASSASCGGRCPSRGERPSRSSRRSTRGTVGTIAHNHPSLGSELLTRNTSVQEWAS